MDPTYRQQWDDSYDSGDNAIFYPKEEVVKFLNRHVRKRTGLDTFRDLLARHPDDHSPWRALDYGCGMARHTILLEEFGMEATGLDLSERSITTGRALAERLGHPALAARLRSCDGRTIPYPAGTFDVALAESCLDCMPFDMARGIIAELDRVTKYLGYITVYSGDNSSFHREYAGDVLAGEPPAAGTVRSYYNWSRLHTLIAGTRWRIRDAHLVEEQSLTRPYKHGRYYAVLEKGAA